MGDSLDNRMNIDSSFTIHSTGRRRKKCTYPYAFRTKLTIWVTPDKVKACFVVIYYLYNIYSYIYTLLFIYINTKLQEWKYYLAIIEMAHNGKSL